MRGKRLRVLMSRPVRVARVARHHICSGSWGHTHCARIPNDWGSGFYTSSQSDSSLPRCSKIVAHKDDQHSGISSTHVSCHSSVHISCHTDFDLRCCCAKDLRPSCIGEQAHHKGEQACKQYDHADSQPHTSFCYQEQAHDGSNQ